MVGAGLPALARGRRRRPRRRSPPPTSTADDIDVLIYAGVCREQFEPATACAVAPNSSINPDAADLRPVATPASASSTASSRSPTGSNSGQAQAGLVVSAETAREINENVIDRMVRTKSLELFRESRRDAHRRVRGGRGAGASARSCRRRSGGELVGGVTKNAPEHHALCRWGVQSVLPPAVGRLSTAP